MFKSLVAAATIAIGLGGAAQAATLDFVVDAAGSSVSLTETDGGGWLCRRTNCGIEASLASGLSGTTFTLGEGATSDFDFLRFEGDGTTGFSDREFTINATLAFLTPSLSVSSDGSGGAFLLAGSIIGGSLIWDDVPVTKTLDDGSIVSIDFQGSDLTLLLEGDTGRTSTASVTVVGIAPVPLPASALFLLAGVGGLAVMRRRSA